MRTRYIIGLESSVDPTDRGLAYGDGLFETMSLRDGMIQRFRFHLDRLATGCARLELPIPDLEELEQQIRTATAGIEQGHIKLILTRGTGPRGYSPPPLPAPTVILMAESKAHTAAISLSVATLTQRLGENEKLAGIKHLNRLEQVLGRLELARLGADEGLMLSTSGNVIGGTSRNLFAVFGDCIKTPLLDRAGIAGVMRRAVLEQCKEMQIAAEETVLEPAELHLADELFMTNALVGLQSVQRLDRTKFDCSVTASKLRGALGLTEDGTLRDA